MPYTHDPPNQSDSGTKLDRVAPVVLGLIPAKGQSRGVPRKNIRPLLGKPLIVHTIETALQSSILTWVVTSTDDQEVAHIARSAGSDIIMRPAELARDDTPMLPVIQHAIQEMEQRTGQKLEYVTLLQPTTPLRSTHDIDEATNKLVTTGCSSVVSLYRVYDFHPQRMKRIIGDQILPYCEEEHEGTRRQDLPPAYHRNGCIYATRRDLPMQKNTLFGDDSRPYIMPRNRSVNIDEEIDFTVAETLLRAHQMTSL